MAKKDYYEILGVSKDASDEDIKKAYRKKSKELHPDKNQGDKQKEEQFKEVAEAFSILGDKDKKYQYDNGGFNSFDMGGFNVNINDILKDFMGGGHGFSGSGFGKKKKDKGQDILVKVALTLEEMHSGINKKIKINKKSLCPTCKGEVTTCNECGGSGFKVYTQQSAFGISQVQTTCNHCGGTGKIAVNKNCKTCNSTGFVDIEEIIDINIPKGSYHGMQLIVPGKGNPIYDGINGDLIIQILQYQNDKFERKDHDLYMTANINIIDILLGTNYEFYSINNTKLTTKIPQFIKNNEKIKIQAQGMPKYGTNDYGDLYLIIKYKMPNKIDDNDLKLLKKLKLSNNFK